MSKINRLFNSVYREPFALLQVAKDVNSPQKMLGIFMTGGGGHSALNFQKVRIRIWIKRLGIRIMEEFSPRIHE